MVNDKNRGRRAHLADLLALAPYLLPHRKTIIIASLFMILASIISIVLPLFSRIAIDTYILPRDLPGLVTIMSISIALLLAMNGLTAIRSRLMANVGQDSIRKIRQSLFTKLQFLPIGFFDMIPVGKVITRLTSDIDALSELVGNAIVSMIVDSLKLVGFLALMFWLDWRLTLIALAFLPLLIFAITFLNARIQRAEDEAREQASVVNANLQESISGIRVIQAFQAQDFFDKKFLRYNGQLLKAGLKAVATFGYFWPTVDFSWLISMAALIYFGGRWVLDGTTTIGTLIAFIAYTGQFFGPLRGLSQAYRIIQRALAGAVRINEIFQADQETDPSLPDMPEIKGNVEFSDVTFGYSGEEMVLQNISFTVSAGQTIALIGHTGAGKTSIINLLCRFYRPQHGRILVDGTDIFGHSLESYRSQVGLVLQEPFLFSGTLRENLAFGSTTATDKQMWSALETVGLRDVFEQHHVSLDTVLSERGSNFSTGQRQLISFARALLANPRLLILDEATAHVDTLTEQKVQAALDKLLTGRTAFVIAHRLSTIRNADRILVIGHGKLLEEGNHEELLKLGGEYWQLCHSQKA